MMQSEFLRAIRHSALGIRSLSEKPRKKTTEPTKKSKIADSVRKEVKTIVDLNNVDKKPIRDVKPRLVKELEDERDKIKHIKKHIVAELGKVDSDGEYDTKPQTPPPPPKKRLTRKELEQKKTERAELVKKEMEKIDENKPLDEVIQELDLDAKKINIFKKTLDTMSEDN